MAIRTWGRVLSTSLAVSLLAGAAQLGVAYGLGLIRFGRAFTNGIENQWNAQLAWIAWIALLSAVAGGWWALRRLGPGAGPATLAGISAAASAGAAGVALITMPAAGTAQLADGASPATAAGTAALLGALAGLPLVALVLWQRAYAWTLFSVAAAAWALAIGSAVPSFGPVRLGVLDPAALGTGVVQRLAVVIMPSLALIAGAAAGAIARRHDHPPVIVATAGLLGPAPFAAAYLIAGPGTPADAYQAAPYWGSLVAMAAGALGSLLAIVVRLPEDQKPATVRGEAADPPAGHTGGGPAGSSAAAVPADTVLPATGSTAVRPSTAVPPAAGAPAAGSAGAGFAGARSGRGRHGAGAGGPARGPATTRPKAPEVRGSRAEPHGSDPGRPPGERPPDAILDPVERESSDTGAGPRGPARISSIGSTGTDRPEEKLDDVLSPKERET